jgi:hypothetical protein
MEPPIPGHVVRQENGQIMNDIETIAAAIHDTWRSLSRAQGWPMGQRLDRPYAELADADKEENRAAAHRMARVLAIEGLGLSNDPARPEAALPEGLETMAEAEHALWVTHRSENGWTWAATRDDAAKHHPSMVPYAQLSETEKDKDRNNVRHYPKFAARAGYRIVRME